MKSTKNAKPGLILFLILVCFHVSCAGQKPGAAIVFSGSTPGDDEVKEILHIPASTVVDFMRWKLAFTEDDGFLLNISYGESKPNTLGFKEEHLLSLMGNYQMTEKVINGQSSKAYTLTTSQLKNSLQFKVIHGGLLHLLDSQGHLKVGNGGWSYNLNKSTDVKNEEILWVSDVSDEKHNEMVFDGRTPCQPFAKEHPEMDVSEACFKLKWKLILKRNPQSLEAEDYIIRKVVDGRPQEVTGKWEIRHGLPDRPNAIIYVIEPDKPAESFALLAADNNILYFLNKEMLPLIGNEDFSFTLNRRIP
ncbi:MAG: hypothetical protein KDC49_04425 [Saprospiraceae bacterium]|nr:hypothetical protein [Saprospiraceae bacterium]